MTETLPGMQHDWDSQVWQYDELGEPGVTVQSEEITLWGQKTVVDSVLYRGEDGKLLGILNHFNENNIWQKPGSCNLWIKPGHQRQGIASALLREAWHRWHLRYEDQDWTAAGDAWLKGLVELGKINPELTDSVNEEYDWREPPPGVHKANPPLRRST